MRTNKTRRFLAVIICIVMCLQLVPIYTRAVNTNNLKGVWEGSYAGHSGSSVVER